MAMTHDDRRDRDVLQPVLARLPARVAGWVTKSARASQLARDATSLVRGFSGPPRPVARRYALSDDALPGEKRLRVLEVRRETRDAMSVVLERPEGETYAAGQFLTLLLTIDGREVRRSYSLSSSPLDARSPYVVTIKRVTDGLASRWLHETLAPGTRLRVRGPSGSFTWAPGDEPEHLLLVGGGSGITPLMGILRAALAGSKGVRVSLVYANRASDDVIFRDELARLAAIEPRLTVHHVLEQATRAFPCREGRVGRDDLASALAGVAISRSRAYVCGPAPMMTGVVADLRALGFGDDAVRVERFVSVRHVDAPATHAPHKLNVLGRTVDVAPGKTLLEAASAAGIELDFSCTMGGCGACKARLVAGDVAMDEPNCLIDAERAEGMILTCIARPTTDVTVAKL